MAQRLTVDEARLRPHLRTRAQLLEQQARIFEREYTRAVAAGVETAAAAVPAGGDAARLRGIPVVARGVAGAQRGSDPLAELLRKQP